MTSRRIGAVSEMRVRLWSIALLCGTWGVQAQEAAIALRGATIETVGKAGRIENGTIILRAGKIESVGAGLAIPETARVIDATGRTITPGWIDPYRVIQVPGDTSESETRTIVIRGRTFTFSTRSSITSPTFTRVADVFYPYTRGERAALRSGICQMNLVSRGVGQSAIVRVTPERPESMMQVPDGHLFASVTNQTQSLDVLRNGLASAVRSGGGVPGGRPPADAGGSPAETAGGSATARPATPAASSAVLELWKNVHSGKSPLVVNANDSATILHVVNALKPYPEVRLLLVANGSNIYETLDSLRGRKVAIILAPMLSLVPHSRDRLCVSRLVHEAGLEFAFSLSLEESNLMASQDTPLFPVAYQVRCGLPRSVALEALTIRPATMLGQEQKSGSLEPGKSANLLVFDGDPLDAGSQLRQVFVEGELVHEN